MYEIPGIVGLDICPVGKEGEFAITGFIDDMNKRNAFLLWSTITPFIATCNDLEIYPEHLCQSLYPSLLPEMKTIHIPVHLTYYCMMPSGRIIQEFQVSQEAHDLDVRTLMSGIYLSIRFLKMEKWNYCQAEKNPGSALNPEKSKLALPP